jgi:3-hydroxyacyl-CoA dehydrogenase
MSGQPSTTHNGGRRLSKQIHKVAILGAGTMGARIAAHFANAGVPSYLKGTAQHRLPQMRRCGQRGARRFPLA